jgi:molybdenum cofactor synthesis domain-containing protein
VRAAILTVSDRCARGEFEDLAGVALREALEEHEVRVIGQSLVADEMELIEAELIRLSDKVRADLVVTTGGTGLGPRDVTPEATEAVLDRKAPGIAEAIRAQSLPYTQTAMLGRGTAGMRGRTLIVNLPGSPRGARECLGIILPVLAHAMEMIAGGGHPTEARDDGGR